VVRPAERQRGGVGESILTEGQKGRGAEGAEPDPLFRDAGLSRRGASLYLGDVRLGDIADGAGTPTYVYSLDVIRARYAALEAALAAVPHRICFAVKANGNLAVLRTLARLGAGADIVSGGELKRALAAGFPAERIVFSGVGKTDAELEAAVEAGVGHVHVESAAELRALAAVVTRRGRPLRLGIRVNPDVTADTHPYIATGRGGIKFGVPFDQVLPLARQVATHPMLTLDTMAMHIGSQILDPRPYSEGARRLVQLVEACAAEGIGSITSLDLGGGLGIRYRDETPLDPGTLLDAVFPAIQGRGLTLALEPGRYLVGPAGILLTEVLSRKHSGGKDLAVVDAGMNDLVRPSHYSAYHEIF
jgi:diaminopimelate decarboxylase